MTDLKWAQRNEVAPWDDLVWQDFHVSVYRDRYPVTNGHLLFVPNYDTDEVIKDAFYSALKQGRHMVETGECDGFNIGLNIGKVAGQTVMYPHVHLIPRRSGDSDDPVGGVRGVIPGQANYHKESYQLP